MSDVTQRRRLLSDEQLADIDWFAARAKAWSATYGEAGLDRIGERAKELVRAGATFREGYTLAEQEYRITGGADGRAGAA